MEEEEPAPLPLLPRALRRRPSMTMPGALFPRSPSMDPEPAPVPKLPRNVHFPTRPTYIDYEVPMPGPSSSPEHVRHPSPSPVPVPVPSRSRAASVSEVTGRRSQEDSASSAWKEKGKQRATDVLLENGTSPSPARSNLSGSGRDAEADVDTSGEIRVRGKEQELSAVRAERRAREKWWETEAETTMIREEKAGYEDKIKKLEEEVMRLQEEVRYFIPYMFPTNCPFKSWRRGLRRTLQITRFLCPRLRRLHLHRPHVYPLSFQGYQQIGRAHV